jgi:LytS/YehU family sensor histidine kinase
MGSQQNILLTNISPGTYKMQVKVYAFDNKWPEQTKEIEITIRPPFWKTPWFLVLLFLVIAGSCYYLYRRRIKGLKQKANLDKQLAQSEMKALHSQMNPHFIFNSLNSISQMVMNDEKINATRYLGNYAQLIRMNLEHSQQTFISLKENIEYLQLYLELEHTRTNNFVHKLEVDAGLEPNDIMLPPMLIQPFIENAIWYGPTGANSSMNLRIRFLKKNDELLCIVEDNGVGINASRENKNKKIPTHRSMGISNVRQRIKILNEKYGLNYRLLIVDKSSENGSGKTGTIVTLALPLNFNYS